MNKKTFLFGCLCAVALCSMNMKAMDLERSSIVYVEDNLPSGYTKIDLRGKLDFNAGPDDIVAGASDHTVYLHFNQGFGNVNICIYNANGSLVYSSVVNTNTQQTFIIPITGGNCGTYTVALNNANGYAEGDFEQN